MCTKLKKFKNFDTSGLPAWNQIAFSTKWISGKGITSQYPVLLNEKYEYQVKEFKIIIIHNSTFCNALGYSKINHNKTEIGGLWINKSLKDELKTDKNNQWLEARWKSYHLNTALVTIKFYAKSDLCAWVIWIIPSKVIKNDYTYFPN